MCKPTKSEVYQMGFERGENLASWQDLPEIGTEIKTFEVRDFIGTIEDVSDAEEVFLSICWEAESNNRDFSPFEFTCKDLNDYEETADFEVWEAFEEGISEGVVANWNSRKDYYTE